MSQLFSTDTALDNPMGKVSMADAPMGERMDNGRYKMPLLPGEAGTKAGGDWVPRGLQSMTNLASSISDTRALGVWEVEQVMIGLGMHPELATELRNVISAAKWQKVDFQKLRDGAAGLELKSALGALAERAKDIGGANAARDAGIVRHDVWEQHGKTQLFTGSDEINAEIVELRKLLDAAGFQIVPHLCERVVRNVAVAASGRFDNILLHQRTGKLYMADLKTKAKKFWSFLEIDGQLAGYANSEWMLNDTQDGYQAGPRYHVDLTEGVVLHMPSAPGEDGSQEPRLRRADLVAGWKTMQLARQVCTARTGGQNAARMAMSWWPVG